jgi:hypothetical protein
MWRDNRVRDAGVAGSNPATPTKILTYSIPYRDSYRDRNVSATDRDAYVAPDERVSEPSRPQTLTPSQPIFLIVETVNRRVVARLAKNTRILCTSRTPFTDTARALFREGVDPKLVLSSRNAGQDYDSLRSTVGRAAKLTVDETRTAFAPWKPFPSSAVSPSIRHPAEAAITPQPPLRRSCSPHLNLRLQTRTSKATIRRPRGDRTTVSTSGGVSP